MTEAPTTFHLFPDLPAEIRRKIWAAAIDHPRLIESILRCGEYLPKPFYRFTSPILSQICQESRDEARLRYHLVHPPGGPHLGSLSYLNPSSDILLLSHNCFRVEHSILGAFTLFNESPNSPHDSAWNSLRAIALCASNAMRIIEPLSSRFPCLNTVFLLQNPEKMETAYLIEKRVAEHLERRRDARGDGKIPSGLNIRVVTLESLRRTAGRWEGQMGCEAQSKAAAVCGTCLIRY